MPNWESENCTTNGSKSTIGKFRNERNIKKITSHVLTGQPPPPKTTLGPWTKIAENIILIKHGSKESEFGHGFRACVHCDLELRDMTFIQGHDTPFRHGQQFWEILSRSNMEVRSYSPDKEFRYMYSVTLKFEIHCMALIQGHDTPSGHGQQLFEILSRSNLALRIYDPHADFGYIYIYILLHCPTRHDIESNSSHTLGHGH